ncbi:MAG: MFS transporter, partial [Rhodospirillales bacterium]
CMPSPATFLRLTLPLAGVNVLNQASRALMATIGPALALEFGLSATELGLLAATFFASYALAQLPAGLGMDLFGVRRVQTTLVTIAATGFALCALSSSALGLAVGRFVTGLGVAVGMIAMLTVHTQWLARDRVAGRTGLGVFVASFGGMMATLPAQQLLPYVGWRGLFWAMAGLGVLVSGWIYVSVPERPASIAPKRSLRAEIVEYGRIARHPAFIAIAPAITLLSGLNFTYGGLWAGPWLRDVGGYEGTVRATLLMCFALGMMVGSLCTGQAASFLTRRGYDAMTVPGIGMAGLLLTQIALILNPLPNAYAIGFWWFMFAFVSASGPAAYAALAHRFPSEIAGRVGTLINLSMLLVVFFLQNAIGWVLDIWPRTASGGWSAIGYSWAMGMTAAAQAAAIVWLLIRRER